MWARGWVGWISDWAWDSCAAWDVRFACVAEVDVSLLPSGDGVARTADFDLRDHPRIRGEAHTLALYSQPGICPTRPPARNPALAHPCATCRLTHRFLPSESNTLAHIVRAKSRRAGSPSTRQRRYPGLNLPAQCRTPTLTRRARSRRVCWKAPPGRRGREQVAQPPLEQAAAAAAGAAAASGTPAGGPARDLATGTRGVAAGAAKETGAGTVTGTGTGNESGTGAGTGTGIARGIRGTAAAAGSAGSATGDGTATPAATSRTRGTATVRIGSGTTVGAGGGEGTGTRAVPAQAPAAPVEIELTTGTRT
jgi:hypothetical protein